MKIKIIYKEFYMKKIISILLIMSVLLTWTGVHLSGLGAERGLEKELEEIYSEILCIGCGGKKTIDHSNDCPVAKDLRAKVRFLVKEGFDKETIVWNFNGNNIAFIYQLPAELIRNLDCPCACSEKVWVCLGSENDCPVIGAITEDIRKFKEQGKSEERTVGLLKSPEYQEKYSLVIESAIKEAYQMRSYDISDIPDFVLDNGKCSCECTESLRTCIERMPWCKRIDTMIYMAKIYLYVMKLEPEDVVSAMYTPCAKVCAKRMEGEYLGKNCSVCQRPILDRAYYKEVDGKEEVFCCRSCYELGSPLPQAVLNNVECKICPCKKVLSRCREEICPLLSVEKRLIKIWLLQDMRVDEIIRKLR